VVVIIVIADII